MDIDGVIKRLKKRAEEFGSQKALADAAGVSQTYISMVTNKDREPNEKLLAFLGLEEVVRPKAYRVKMTPEEAAADRAARRKFLGLPPRNSPTA